MKFPRFPLTALEFLSYLNFSFTHNVNFLEMSVLNGRCQSEP